MSVFYADLVLAAWLVFSVFTFGHSRDSALLVALGAAAAAALARLAVVRPALRLGVGAVAVALALSAVILPGVSAPARVNTVLGGLLLLGLSAVVPAHGPGRPPPVFGLPRRLPAGASGRAARAP